jgi:hypothetical protein
MINPLNQIIVQCPRNSTTHARLTVFSNGLLVEHGRTVDGLAVHFMQTGDKEILAFADHPELAALFDGYAWNTAELHDFIVHMGTIDFEVDTVPEQALAAQA